MAFLLKDSPECAKSELDLFSLPPTQTVIEKGQWVEFHPLANVSEGSPVEFNVSGSGDDYLDLSQTQLYVKVKILKNDGKPITAESKVGPVNLFLHSMFSQVDISLNERLVSTSNNTYPYRAMIEKLLNHGFDTKTSQLSSELFFKDTAGRMNVFDIQDTQPNEGFNQRAELFKLSASVDMIGRLHLDMFHQERLLLNMVDMKIKLIRSKPEFCLLGEGEFKVLLEQASLFVRKVRVSPGVVLGHAKSLEKSTAKYPINRVLCKAYSIPTGNMSFIQDNIFIGQMPNRIVVACVDNDAFNGNYKKSPFEFKHYNMNFIGVYVDGQPDATSTPFSYLLIDLRPETSETLRLRTGIFPGDKYYVYQPR
ncbi:uncharacterized protein F54H12.2-like [Stegodyphus dumicola]|uniref:uncharacterized protein F54H12.2-like n=3 Tax=Stegodyphus dumicola TaxID=202533 RepID=UPI0015AAE473|nr:uncharacterized protein F54H12.2-like [Stegodyphus dumicola]XP_035212856.1 uncharacterized protein F54H12.2-like [Stegodyphus dumicola]